jgi:hypothetical protein
MRCSYQAQSFSYFFLRAADRETFFAPRIAVRFAGLVECRAEAVARLVVGRFVLRFAFRLTGLTRTSRRAPLIA